MTMQQCKRIRKYKADQALLITTYSLTKFKIFLCTSESFKCSSENTTYTSWNSDSFLCEKSPSLLKTFHRGLYRSIRYWNIAVILGSSLKINKVENFPVGEVNHDGNYRFFEKCINLLVLGLELRT